MLEWIPLLYCIFSALFLGIRHRRDKREFWVRLVLVLSLPVIGFLLPAFWPKRWHDRRRNLNPEVQLVFFENVVTQFTNQSGLYRKPDSKKEMNVVPLQEALLVNDLSTRRRVMIDLLKMDSLEYLDVLKMAVSNEDTETSHYAVSAIMEVKRKLTLGLQQLSVQYEENKDDPYVLRSYADVLKNYMRSGFLDEQTLVKHNHIYSMVLGRLLEINPEYEEAYAEKINADLDLGQYAVAENTARRYLERFPRSEDAYLSLMKVYFTVRSFDQLKTTVEELKSSPVRFSHQALTLVRFWSEGVEDGFESQIKT